MITTQAVSTKTMLTTKDNPYSPFTQFDAWRNYDEAQGYNTCGYLARIAKVSDSLSAEEYDTALEDAIDEIISINPLGIHIKVTEDVA